MSDVKYDRAAVEAAVAAAPIFAAKGWTYGTGDAAHVPDVAELMATVQRLVNNLRATDVELDVDGYGEAFTGTGRWRVTRTITPYLFDPSDDEITIMLELGELDT